MMLRYFTEREQFTRSQQQKIPERKFTVRLHGPLTRSAYKVRLQGASTTVEERPFQGRVLIEAADGL